MPVIITKEAIEELNNHYGTEADSNDADHYKLCQVILHLEQKLMDNNLYPRAAVKSIEEGEE